MLEHKCKECRNIWHDNEYDTCCPNCWSGEYTTEYAETTIIDDTKYCVDCGEEIKDEQ